MGGRMELTRALDGGEDAICLGGVDVHPPLAASFAPAAIQVRTMACPDSTATGGLAAAHPLSPKHSWQRLDLTHQIARICSNNTTGYQGTNLTTTGGLRMDLW
jgi:hypothetical protein